MLPPYSQNTHWHSEGRGDHVFSQVSNHDSGHFSVQRTEMNMNTVQSSWVTDLLEIVAKDTDELQLVNLDPKFFLPTSSTSPYAVGYWKGWMQNEWNLFDNDDLSLSSTCLQSEGCQLEKYITYCFSSPSSMGATRFLVIPIIQWSFKSTSLEVPFNPRLNTHKNTHACAKEKDV